MTSWAIRSNYNAMIALAAFGLAFHSAHQTCPAAEPARASPPLQGLVSQYCLGCHSGPTATAGLDLKSIGSVPVVSHTETWEKVVHKLTGRQMPPAGLPKPSDEEYRSAVSSLSSLLDREAAAYPRPGRTDTFRRLNRTEYRNAIRDLLALDVRVDSLLPSDEASHGFDNITVGDLPPMLLERYVSAAEKISRLAVGLIGRVPDAVTIRVPPDLTQEGHIAGLPIGTRGGMVVPHVFPVDGEYEISVRLARDRNEDIEGLRWEHELELLVDRRRVVAFDVKPPPRGDDHRNADRHLRARVQLDSGPHRIGATFLKDPSRLLETQRQPYQAHFNFYRHPRIQPAVHSLTIVGPYASGGPGNTPSRERIFLCMPTAPLGGECLRKKDRPQSRDGCVPQAGYRHRYRGTPEVLRSGPRQGRGRDWIRSGNRERPRGNSGEPPIPVPHREGTRPESLPTPPIASANWNSLLDWPSFSGAACRTAGCAMPHLAASWRHAKAWNAKFAACSPIPDRSRSSTTSRHSGFTFATWPR